MKVVKSNCKNLKKADKPPLIQFQLFIFYKPACLQKNFHGRVQGWVRVQILNKWRFLIFAFHVGSRWRVAHRTRRVYKVKMWSLQKRMQKVVLVLDLVLIWSPLLYKTNRFLVGVRLFSNRSQKTSNVVRTSVTHSTIVSSATFLFLPHFEVSCDKLLNRRTATWNLFVK